MKLDHHYQLKFMQAMLVLASKDLSKTMLSQELKIAKDKMHSHCNHCASKTSKLNPSPPWQGPDQTLEFLTIWDAQRDETNVALSRWGC